MLLLDEPTNDLDIATLSVLEDYLETFPGPVLAVSHDRYFLDRIAGEILEVRGTVTRYVGNYSDYAARRPAPESAPEKSAGRPKGAPPRPKKLKFSYHEQREFERIDDEIAALEEEIAACDREMEDHASDYTALERLTAQRESLSAALEEKTERWVYLNDLAERIEAQKNG